MRSPNFLILDEPTNDLDIVTLGILEDYLRSFNGCLIVISHDRFFLDSIVDHLFVFEGDGKIKDFPGGYSDYREWTAMQAQQSTATDTKASSTSTAEKEVNRKRKLSFKEQREFDSLMDEIEKLTAEKEELEAAFNSGEVDDIVAKSARYEEVKSLLDEKEMRWLELSEI